MKRWEYRTVRQSGPTKNFLEAMGLEGWEMCGCHPAPDIARPTTFYFKRRIRKSGAMMEARRDPIMLPVGRGGNTIYPEWRDYRVGLEWGPYGRDGETPAETGRKMRQAAASFRSNHKKYKDWQFDIRVKRGRVVIKRTA